MMKNGKKDMSDKLKLKGHMKAFMRWPLILSALLIVLNIWVYFVSVKAGIIVSGGILIYVGCAVIILRCHRPFIVNELIAFANQYDSLEKRILEELALPYAIMDMNGRMIWSNKVFAEQAGNIQPAEKVYTGEGKVKKALFIKLIQFSWGTGVYDSIAS